MIQPPRPIRRLVAAVLALALMVLGAHQVAPGMLPGAVQAAGAQTEGAGAHPAAACPSHAAPSDADAGHTAGDNGGAADAGAPCGHMAPAFLTATTVLWHTRADAGWSPPVSDTPAGRTSPRDPPVPKAPFLTA